jgi:hypothetical protein
MPLEWRVDPPAWFDQGKRIATRLSDGRVVEGVLVHHPELTQRQGNEPVWMVRADGCELYFLGDRWCVVIADAITEEELRYLMPRPGEARFGA